MKKNIIWFVCAMVMLLSFVGCSPKATEAPNEASTGQISNTLTTEKETLAPAPSEKAPDNDDAASKTPSADEINWMDVKKYDLTPQEQEFVTIKNPELYKAVYDAIDQLQPEIDISGFESSKEEIQDVLDVLWLKTNAEFFYFSMEPPQLSEDGKKITFSYMNRSKEDIMQMKQKFADEVNHIFNNIVDTDASELEKELAVYDYLVKLCTYNDDALKLDVTPEELMSLSKEEQIAHAEKLKDIDPTEKTNTLNAYSVIVDKKGICFGFTGALNFLYNKIGIECRVITSVPNTHSWNIVKIDGTYYHLDLTRDVVSEENGLKFVNFTDDQRKEDDILQKWKDSFGEKLKDSHPCTDNRFDYLRTVGSFKLENGMIEYKDTSDGKSYQMKIDGTDKKAVKQ